MKISSGKDWIMAERIGKKKDEQTTNEVPLCCPQTESLISEARKLSCADKSITEPETTEKSDTMEQAANSDHSPWVQGKILLNEFQIQSVLGHGGCGSVYLVNRCSNPNELYALKTVHKSMTPSWRQTRFFLRELRAWMELPEHPHIVSCYFFRTIENRIAIFAEYVDGGTLHQWIRQGKLRSMEAILHTTLQLAWGIQVAHDYGVIHQDIKPGNVLMTEDGIAKLSDFSLARTQRMEFQSRTAIPRASVMVSTSGMTAAYCSPEQFLNKRLNHKTDIWSWGLVVLEMFIGERIWEFGYNAADALREYCSNAPYGNLPRMPDDVISILERCFTQNPQDRWESMQEITEQLSRACQQQTGKVYPQSQARTKLQSEAKRIVYPWQRIKGRYYDPIEWLNRARTAAGKYPVERLDSAPLPDSSWRIQALHDIEICEEAQHLYEELIASGYTALTVDLGELLLVKAHIHQAISDFSGALTICDTCIVAAQQHTAEDDQEEVRSLLARAYMFKALYLLNQGNHQACISNYTQAISILHNLRLTSETVDTIGKTATSYLNRAVAYNESGDNHAALQDFNEAQNLYELLIASYAHRRSIPLLALVFVSKSKALWESGEKDAALDSANQAIELLGSYKPQSDDAYIAKQLAYALSNKAVILLYMDHYEPAVPLLYKAITLLDAASEADGFDSTLGKNILTRRNLASALIHTGKLSEALVVLGEAQKHCELLVKRGQHQYELLLGKVCYSKAEVFLKLGRYEESNTTLLTALAIFKRFHEQQPEGEALFFSISSHIYRLPLLAKLDSPGKALLLCDMIDGLLEAHKKSLSTDYALLRTRFLLEKANIYSELNDYASALPIYDTALALIEKITDAEDKAEIASLHNAIVRQRAEAGRRLR